MTLLDYLVLSGYFIAVAWIGVWSSKHARDSSSDFFLGGRGIGWAAVGASLFASNISAEHFIGLAGSGAVSGLAVGQFEWLACVILLLLGWLFVPHYLRTRVFTMPEFLERRYNRSCRTYLSAMSLVAYVFTKVSVAVYAGALVLHTIMGWNMWAGAIVLIVATGAYTIFGGLRAVIYTDYMQCFVLIAGGIVLTWAAVAAAGGLGTLLHRVPAVDLSVWRSMDHPDFPWTGILFGAPILGIWYWCTDQMIVQRTLASANLSEARKATVFAGYLKLLPVFILVLPGLAGRFILPDVEPDAMYAALVQRLLPTGLRGLVMAGLLAALMSSLSSVFNSAATLLVIDFYRHLRPNAGEKQLVRAGQISTLVLVGIGLAWLPFIGLMNNQLYVYLQSVQAYIAPPIAAVFLGGLLWHRANGTGALATLIVGLATGTGRFLAELATKAQWVETPLLVTVSSINFLHFAVASFVLSVVVLIAVSLATPPPASTSIDFLTRRDNNPIGDHQEGSDGRGWAIALVITLVALWIYFSPWFIAHN